MSVHILDTKLVFRASVHPEVAILPYIMPDYILKTALNKLNEPDHLILIINFAGDFITIKFSGSARDFSKYHFKFARASFLSLYEYVYSSIF